MFVYSVLVCVVHLQHCLLTVFSVCCFVLRVCKVLFVCSVFSVLFLRYTSMSSLCCLFTTFFVFCLFTVFLVLFVYNIFSVLLVYSVFRVQFFRYSRMSSLCCLFTESPFLTGPGLATIVFCSDSRAPSLRCCRLVNAFYVQLGEKKSSSMLPFPLFCFSFSISFCSIFG